jgi:hypothetical protein
MTAKRQYLLGFVSASKDRASVCTTCDAPESLWKETCRAFSSGEDGDGVNSDDTAGEAFSFGDIFGIRGCQGARDVLCMV